MARNQKFGAVNDNDDSLQSKPNGKFGLNKANITVFEFTANGGKDGTPADAVKITGSIGGREYYNTVYGEPTLWDKDGNQWEDDGSDEWFEKFEAAQTQGRAVIIHTLKALGVSQDAINQAFATPVDSWAEWARIAVSLVPNGFESIPVHLFLEYQWSIGSGNDRTYLLMPKNMKGGKFLSPYMPGEWKEERTAEGLVYKLADGTEHPITKTADYMDSAKAYQQVEGQDNAAQGANMNSAEAPKSTW